MNVAEQFLAAVGELRGIAAADQICITCVDLLGVDAAVISLILDGATATLGASSAAARRYDDVQFLMGEGPGLDSVAQRTPVIVYDLADPAEVRWPHYRPAMLAQSHPVRAVAAIPMHLAGRGIGALTLFHPHPTDLTGARRDAAVLAANLARLPLLDVLDDDLYDDATADPWPHMQEVIRAEVAQATGMVMAQLDIGAAEALLRIRAHAYATTTTTAKVARAILTHQLRLDPT